MDKWFFENNFGPHVNAVAINMVEERAQLLAQIKSEISATIANIRNGTVDGDFPEFWEGKLAGLTFARDLINKQVAQSASLRTGGETGTSRDAAG